MIIRKRSTKSIKKATSLWPFLVFGIWFLVFYLKTVILYE